MPIHDWTCVPSRLFHHFYHRWTIRITDALNSGRLRKGISTLVEQCARPKEPDVLAIQSRGDFLRSSDTNGGSVAVIEKPTTSIIRRTEKEFYVGKANRIVVKHHLGRIIAVMEIISPANKDGKASPRDFVDKTIGFLREGIYVLVVDLFLLTPRDPYGIHKAIWDEIEEEDFTFPQGKDRVLASYQSGSERVAYIEPAAFGDELPEMPLFLTSFHHVKVPLEPTYMATWAASPEEMRMSVETGVEGE